MNENNNINQETLNISKQEKINNPEEIKKDLIQEKLPEPQKNGPTPKVSQSSNKKTLVLAIGVIGLILIVIGIIMSNTNNTLEKKNKATTTGTEKEEIFYYLYKDDNKTYYYIDEKEKIYTYKGYVNISEFNDGLAVFSKFVNGETIYGVMDKEEKEVIKSGEYSDISETLSSNYYIVNKNSKYGVIDTKGNIAVPIEYENIRSFGSEDDKPIFLVKKDDKYSYVSTNGTLMMETENYGYFNSNVKTFPMINNEYDELVYIDGKNYFNARTGEQLFKEQPEGEKINFNYNILFESKKNITIYDKELKVKETISTPDTTNITIEQLKTGHIVLIEMIYKEGKTSSKYRIFDENLKQLKEVDCANIRTVSINVINDEYFYILERFNYIEDGPEYKVTVYDNKLKTYTRESKNYIKPYTNDKNEIIFVETNYDTDETTIYNAKGEELFTKANHHMHSIVQEYIILSNTNKTPQDKYYNRHNLDVYSKTGDLIIENVESVLNFGEENQEIKDTILEIENQQKETYLYLKNGNQIKEKNFKYWHQAGNKIVSTTASSPTKVKIYDVKGKVKQEFTDITETQVYDKYVMLRSKEKIKIYNADKDKIVFEFERSKMENNYSIVNIIELTDGFYNFEGKKIIEKTQKTN